MMISPKRIGFFFFFFSLCVAELHGATDSEISFWDTVKDLKQRLELTEAQVQSLKSQNEDLEKQVEKITKELKTVVAFTATLQTENLHEVIGPFPEDFTLKYENVITNDGIAYDPNTGMFTAPVKGVYFFTFVIFNPWKNATGAKLMKNGEMVVSASDNPPGEDTEDTTSNSVTLLLEPSDTVYMQMFANRAVYTDGNRRNTFSGFLLSAK
ncbi:complement C1q-like protein 3 [Clupea harengus]|uniref:Complement C1q-like protein 3 n=1 Tax=Clupea harengus TaxID=7950 RepID=A0A8M1KLW4_CLUHA|nr:complement C1q-like protein 3 [Clupea harengus]